MSHPLLTNIPCRRCKKSPRVFWQRHPDHCRDCARALGLTRKPKQTPYERRPQVIEPITYTKPPIAYTKPPIAYTKPPMPKKPAPPTRLPKQDVERDTKMVSVEEARLEAARLYGSYHPGPGDE